MPDPISVAITRRVRPEAIAAFEQAVRDWIPTAVTFPGHLGVLLLRPSPGEEEYVAVLRFQNAKAWQEFQKWRPYQTWLDSLRPLLVDEAAITEQHGLEAWFDIPATLRPPRWKMALVTWTGVNLTAYCLTLTLVPVIESWPFALRFVTFNAGVVIGLTWLVMPLLTRILHRWLHRR